jgi:PiT family inorganic phosphate transporter
VVGIGAIKRFLAVRWGVTKKILYTWIFTLPGTALLASLIYLIGIRFS